MNNKLTFPDVVALLAEATGSSNALSELFVREMFNAIKSSLKKGNDVAVDGLGVFQIISQDSRKGGVKVTFTPDTLLAEKLNAPFSAFETLILDDDVPDDVLMEDKESDPLYNVEEPTGITDDTESEQSVSDVAMIVPEGEDNVSPEIANQESELELGLVTDTEPNVESEDEQMTTPPPFTPDEKAKGCTETESSPAVRENGASVSEEGSEGSFVNLDFRADENAASNEQAFRPEFSPVIPQLQTSEQREAYQCSVKRGMRDGFLWGIVLGILFVGICSICCWHVLDYFKDNKSVETSQVPSVSTTKIERVEREHPDTILKKGPTAMVNTDSILRPKTVAHPSSVVTDTISQNMYLTKMSAKHYGSPHFWIYIYEENAAKIKDPNNIPPGTVLVIPAKEKYGIDANSKESRDKAKRKAYNMNNSFKM